MSVSARQRDVLEALRRCTGPVTSFDLSEAFAADPPAWVGWDREGLAVVLRRLEALGLAERVPPGAAGEPLAVEWGAVPVATRRGRARHAWRAT